MNMDNLNNHIFSSAHLLKTIGHPIRVQIIITLSQYSEMTVTQLSNFLSIDQPVMSLHLAILRKKHVIKAQKKGKLAIYSIEDVSVKQIVNLAYHSREL